MGMTKKYYVIAGYNLTRLKTDKYEEWKWTDEGDKYLCYQTVGNVQLFDDPMSSRHLYLGFILASGDEYEYRTSTFDIKNIEYIKYVVDLELNRLIDIGVISKHQTAGDEYQIIAFEECT